jgi:predicted O-methyltransferase YrrM
MRGPFSPRRKPQRPSSHAKTVPPRGVSPAELRELNLVMGGFAFFQALVAGTQLDIFGRLAARPGTTLAGLARALRLRPHPLRVLLLGLCSAGLLHRDRAGGYRNTRVADRFLVPERGENLLAAIAAYHALIYKPLFHLTDAVRTGQNVGLAEFPGPGATLYKRLARRPAEERIFQDWLHMVSAHSNDALRAIPTLSRVRHLLDVGGGDGTNGIAMRRAHPNMKITVFDLPSVCRLAAKNIRHAGLEQVVSTAPGDFLTDSFPRGADGILFGHILNIFGEARNRQLLRRAHRALPRGGIVICFNSMTDDTEMGPPRSALLSLYFLALASGEGMVYPWKDYRAWFTEVGFRKVEVHRVGDVMDHGIVVGTK